MGIIGGATTTGRIPFEVRYMSAAISPPMNSTPRPPITSSVAVEGGCDTCWSVMSELMVGERSGMFAPNGLMMSLFIGLSRGNPALQDGEEARSFPELRVGPVEDVLNVISRWALPPNSPCGRDAPRLAASESPLGNVVGRPSVCARFVSDPTCLLRTLREVRAEEALGRPAFARTTT